jgi:2-phosphosulfolactate phosphatase
VRGGGARNGRHNEKPPLTAVLTGPLMTQQEIRVHFLPLLVEPEDLAGRCVIVVDILRATTTILYALAAGATEVRAVGTVQEARELAKNLESPHVLGGERGGIRIEGFDLGNSPEEYSVKSVGGRVVIFSTTNGTKAMKHAAKASKCFTGAFVGFSALCRVLREETAIDILCAGTNGQVTREDVLFAGAVIDDLGLARGVQIDLNDQGAIALDAWRAAKAEWQTPRLLLDRLRASLGGRNVIEIGQERDIEIAAEIDKLDVLGVLDPRNGVIRAGS